jgi:hypothetical protein
MDPISRDVWWHLEAAHAGDTPLPVFEQWVYESALAQRVLGPDAYFALAALDYRGRFAVHDTRALIERLYAERRPGALPIDRARRVAREFLDGHRDLWSTSATLATIWRTDGEEWVPIEFVGIDSELDSIPPPGARAVWDAGALAARLKDADAWLQWAHATAGEAAAQMLARLDATPDSA